MTIIAVQQRPVSIISKYALNAPRYTSYPTALKFEPLQDDILPQALAESKAPAVSLYVHISICKTLCYYCGCNKMVTRHNEKADEYLDYIEKEILSKRYLTDSGVQFLCTWVAVHPVFERDSAYLFNVPT